MNYYERHLGDYSKDTAHLTMIEHGAYSLLLDRYYGTESGIPNDQIYRVARARKKEEKHAVDVVLAEFFQLSNGFWINKRAEEEIAKTKVKINAAKENGKKGGRPKNKTKAFENETQRKPTGLFLGLENETQQKAHQSPDTIHQLTPTTPISVVGAPETTGIGTSENATRVGGLCQKLRIIGIDAAPHLAVWPELLEKFTDAQIVSVAEIAKSRKPGERIHLHYLVPILSEAQKSPASGNRKPAPDNFENRDYGTGGRL